MTSKRSSQARPSIRTVAAQVGLSPSTVSLALRGADTISPETRDRVLEAAQALNYVPAQRSPKQGLSERRLLFVMQDHGNSPVRANPFYGEVLSGVEQECAALGISLSFAVLGGLHTPMEQLPAALRARGLDGVLLVGPYAHALVKRISAELTAPLVLVDNLLPSLPFDTVRADDFGGGYNAVTHLVEGGHRTIAVLIGPTMVAQMVPSFSERYRGASAAADEAGLAPLVTLKTTWERPTIRSALEQVLASPQRPTGLFCVNDDYAVFAIDALRDLGLQVPRDVSVIGFDDLGLAQMAHPPLTTMHNHPHQLGRAAVQRLLARLQGDTSPPQSIAIGARLMLRESTRALRER